MIWAVFTTMLTVLLITLFNSYVKLMKEYDELLVDSLAANSAHRETLEFCTELLKQHEEVLNRLKELEESA